MREEQKMDTEYSYVYKHENGEFIWKNAFVVDLLGAFDYFDSPFVLKYWRLPTTDKATALLLDKE